MCTADAQAAVQCANICYPGESAPFGDDRKWLSVGSNAHPHRAPACAQSRGGAGTGASEGATRHGTTRHNTRRDETRRDETRRDETRRGATTWGDAAARAGPRPRSGGMARTHPCLRLSLDDTLHARAPLIALRRLRGPELARIKAPAIPRLVGGWVPLGGQQDEPLLTLLLIEVRVRVPRPQHGAARQDLLRTRAALVGEYAVPARASALCSPPNASHWYARLPG